MSYRMLFFLPWHHVVGWDEPLVTMECLLNACLDIQEAEDNYSSSDEEDFVPRTLLHGAQPDPPIGTFSLLISLLP